MKRTKVGIIGCGMISDTYFKAAQKFNIIEVVACSDIIPERAAKKTELYGVPNMTNEELLAREDIEIVLNLTPPRVHSKIAMDTLNAGKHAYSEKPFGVDADDAAKVMALAKEKGLRVGCAPDTFLGGGQQTARKLIDTAGSESLSPEPQWFSAEVPKNGPKLLSSMITEQAPCLTSVLIMSRLL